MRFTIYATLCLMLAVQARAQQRFLTSADVAHRVRSMVPAPQADLIVGATDPNEVRVIDAPATVYGNIIVLNNGVLRCINTELRIAGNIICMQAGRVEVRGGTLRVLSSYRYQRSILLVHGGAFSVDSAEIDLGGFNIGCGLIDSAGLSYDHVTVRGGVITTSLASRARMQCMSTVQPGEILFFDRCRAEFRDTRAVLLWLVAPKGCDIDATLPPGAHVAHWAFPDSARKGIGVQARLELEECTEVLWGAITETGSALRLSDTELLVCGLLFHGAGTSAISGLTNGGGAMTKDFAFTDRGMSIARTSVRVWNLYPSDETSVSIASSIIGEVLCMGHAQALMTNSICDGTGGYAGANDSSGLTMVGSMISTDVIARHKARIVLVGCTVSAGGITAGDNGSIAVLNTTFPTLPQALPGAAVLIGSIDEPGSGYCGTTIPVYGTAKLIVGTEVPVSLEAALLDAYPEGVPEKAMRISEHHPGEVYRGMLGQWNTRGLAPGPHVLRLALVLSSGDTIGVTKAVQLYDSPAAVGDAPSRPASYTCSFAPNPVPRGARTVTMTITPPIGNAMIVSVYDLFGREIPGAQATAFDASCANVQLALDGLAPGTYLVTIRSGASAVAAMLVLSR